MLHVLVVSRLIVWLFLPYSQEVSRIEAQWVAQRAALRCLALQHPEWTRPQLAQACGASLSFVNKWLKRFREADPTDLQVLFSRSRARHTPPAPPDLRLVQRILEICTAPPENAARVRRGLVPFSTISNATLTYRLRASSLLPPHARVFKILHKLGFILDPSERTHKPLEPRDPLQEIQMDFKHATTVPANSEGKRQHVLNFV